MKCPAANVSALPSLAPLSFLPPFSSATSQPAISILPRAQKFSPSSTIFTRNSTAPCEDRRGGREFLRSRGHPSRWLYLERTAARPCSRRILLMFLALWHISLQQWWNHRLRLFLTTMG